MTPFYSPWPSAEAYSSGETQNGAATGDAAQWAGTGLLAVNGGGETALIDNRVFPRYTTLSGAGSA